MCKIFQIIRSTDIGGSEIIALSLAENRLNLKMDLIIPIVIELHPTRNNYAFDKKKELAFKKIKFISLTNLPKRLSLIIAPISLTYHIIKEKPEIIHSHTDLPDLVLATTLRILSLLKVKPPKIVRTIHNFSLWSAHHSLGKYTESAFIDDSIVGVSETALTAYQSLRRKYNLSYSKYQRIIYNGCKLPIKKVHDFKIDKEKINIAFCGRFEDQKGIDVLINRLRNLPFIDKFVFHIIGNGKHLDKVLKLSLDLPQVILYDPVANFSEKLYDFDFLIMPSRFEGLVLTSIEASYSKVPVIAAIAPGLTETLPPNWPLNFNLGSEEELFSIFSKIINDEYNLDSLKAKAFDFVSANFSHARMIDNYSKLYNEIIFEREKNINSVPDTPTDSGVLNSRIVHKEQ